MLVLVFSLAWFAVRMERTRPQKAAVEVAELDRLARIEQEFFDKKDEFSVLYEMFMEDDELMQLGDGISSKWAINDYRFDYYGEYEPGDGWCYEEDSKTTLSEILLDVRITQEKYDLYLERMDALGVREINKHGVGGYSFEASFGMLDGADVAVRYIPGGDFNEFVHGLMLSDAHEIPPKTVGGYYLPLEGNWYLYYFWHGPLEY